MDIGRYAVVVCGVYNFSPLLNLVSNTEKHVHVHPCVRAHPKQRLKEVKEQEAEKHTSIYTRNRDHPFLRIDTLLSLLQPRNELLQRPPLLRYPRRYRRLRSRPRRARHFVSTPYLRHRRRRRNRRMCVRISSTVIITATGGIRHRARHQRRRRRNTVRGRDVDCAGTSTSTDTGAHGRSRDDRSTG